MGWLTPIVFGLVFGAILSVPAMGMSIVYRTTDVLHFAWGAYMMIGVFAAFGLQRLGIGILPSILVAILCVGLLSTVLAEITIRPLYGRGLLSLLLVTIGIDRVLLNGVQFFAGPDSRIFEAPSFGLVSSTPVVTVRSVLFVGLSLACFLALYYTMFRTGFGRRLRAIAANPDLAEVRGIDTQQELRKMWFLTGLLAGIGGVMMGIRQGFSPYFGQLMVPYLFAAIIVGGIEDFRGAFVAALALGVAVRVVSYVYATEWGLAVALGLILVMLLVRPTGIASIWQSDNRVDIA
jgi:branched-subunit amino acid ABC-type transport system permease component